MISRIVDCNVQSTKLNEFTNRLTNTFLPRIKSQPGFVDVVESTDAATGHFVCMTLWETREDVEQYEKTLFPEIANTLTPYLTEPPKVSTMTVENSTIHGIERGRGQAA